MEQLKSSFSLSDKARQRYLQILADYDQGISEQLQSNPMDYEELTGIFHKLKGNGALYGYFALSQFSERLLNAIQHHQHDKVRPLMIMTHQEIQSILSSTTLS